MCPTVVSYFPLFHKWTNPVKHAVEQTRDHREDCGPQSFQVVHQKFDVSLEKPDSASVDEDDALVRAHSHFDVQNLLVSFWPSTCVDASNPFQIHTQVRPQKMEYSEKIVVFLHFNLKGEFNKNKWYANQYKFLFL